MEQLEDEQYELLARFVETHRNIAREYRSGFLASEVMNEPQTTFIHIKTNARFQGSLSDADVLARYGLLDRSFNSQGYPVFTVIPRGIVVYEQRKQSRPAPETISNTYQQYLASVEFRKHHIAAAEKWEHAARLLWSADSAQQLTTIGHLCRESLQAFAASLAAQRQVDVSAIPPASTVSRLRAIVDARRPFETTKASLLDAMIAYWKALSDFTQRQEHGGQKEGRPVIWEDARALVFQTCVVMFELARQSQ